MSDERNNLNEDLVRHCGAKAQKEFGLMASASAPSEVLWQAIAATVIIEATRYLRAKRGGNEDAQQAGETGGPAGMGKKVLGSSVAGNRPVTGGQHESNKA